MPSRLLQFLRPTFYALAAFGAIAGATNLYWSTKPPADDSLAGLSGSELAGIDLEKLTLPSPSLAPDEVVRLQLNGLSDPSADGGGMLQCFCLASPANRSVTGPLERFGEMVRSGPFQCMTRPRAMLIGRPFEYDGTAKLIVTIIDEQHAIHAFAFFLSKQDAAPFKDCWMTNAVLPASPTPAAPPVSAPAA